MTRILNSAAAGVTGNSVHLGSGNPTLWPIRLLAVGGFAGATVLIQGSPNDTDWIDMTGVDDDNDDVTSLADDKVMNIIAPIEYIRAVTQGGQTGNATVYLMHA